MFIIIKIIFIKGILNSLGFGFLRPNFYEPIKKVGTNIISYLLQVPLKKRGKWILDSGYSKHMTGDKDMLINTQMEILSLFEIIPRDISSAMKM